MPPTPQSAETHAPIATDMTPRQRALACFAGEITDKVPLHLTGLSSYAASVILGRTANIGGGINQWREAQAMWRGDQAHREFVERSADDAWQITLKTGQDIHRGFYWRAFGKPFAKYDAHTFAFGDPDGEFFVHRYDPETEMFQEIERGGPPLPQSVDELARWWDAQRNDFEKHRAERRAAFEREMAEQHQAFAWQGRTHVVRMGGGGIALPYKLPVWFEAMIERPDLCADYLDHQLEIAMWQLEAHAAAGVKWLTGGGDMASNQGPFYSPRIFRELVLPRWRKYSTACHERGVYWGVASDGNLWPVADDFLGHSDVDSFLEIDRLAGMDLRALRERFPKVTLVGNIASHTMARGTEQQVIDQTRDCLDAARELGHIVVGNSNYILPGSPERNIHAMLETMHQYR